MKLLLATMLFLSASSAFAQGSAERRPAPTPSQGKKSGMVFMMTGSASSFETAALVAQGNAANACASHAAARVSPWVRGRVTVANFPAECIGSGLNRYCKPTSPSYFCPIQANFRCR